MPKWISVTEAAKLTGYSVFHLRELIRSGAITAEKFATVWRVDRDSLMAYVKNQAKKGEKRGRKTSV